VTSGIHFCGSFDRILASAAFHPDPAAAISVSGINVFFVSGDFRVVAKELRTK
jgi:hypothetical protein